MLEQIWRRRDGRVIGGKSVRWRRGKVAFGQGGQVRVVVAGGLQGRL
jgi:hypothetical protein